MKLDELEREIIWRLRLDEGESWSDIGHRLGTSKQAAWERFGKPFPTQAASLLVQRGATKSRARGKPARLEVLPYSLPNGSVIS